MLEKLYTIEWGIIGTDKEKYCTNETNYIDYEEYKKDLGELLISSIGQNADEHKIGFYIECYCDEQELNEEDLFELKEYKTITDCAMKCNMIANYIIDYSGDCIDYVYKD